MITIRTLGVPVTCCHEHQAADLMAGMENHRSTRDVGSANFFTGGLYDTNRPGLGQWDPVRAYARDMLAVDLATETDRYWAVNHAR